MSSTQQLLLGEGAGGAAPVYIEDVFQTWLYTGNGSTQTITNNIDLSGNGGLVWVKRRDSGARSHRLYDTLRGVYKELYSNQTNAQVDRSSTSEGLSQFNANGFSFGASNYDGTNESGVNYVSWTFREQAKFFDVVTYTGNGVAGRQIAHSLGSAPGMIIVKNTSTSGIDWQVYHRSLGNGQAIFLNLTNAAQAFGAWNYTDPTATNFTVSGSGEVNGSSQTYVAYLFAHNAGGFGLTGTDNVISCGSYTGTGSAQLINLGYEPQWVLIKQTDAADQWAIIDNMRGWAQSDSATLCANTANAENADFGASGATSLDPQGFMLWNANGALNQSGGTYIYIAIRRGPMKVPTSATTVFNPDYAWNTSSSIMGYLGQPTDAFWLGYLSGNAVSVNTRTRLVGGNRLTTSSTSAEVTDTTTTYWSSQLGFQTGGSLTTSLITWNFRRAPGFFDVVCATASAYELTANHNLGVVPELIIAKNRNTTSDWYVWASLLSTTQTRLKLNEANASANTGYPINSVTSTSFYAATANTPTATQVFYLFATCAGVSKVGSYTGTGALQTVNCGFTSGARFVFIKRTDSTGGWFTYDSVRGITASDDPYLLLNSSAAQVTNTNYVDTDSTGFKVTAAAPAELNASGGTYIFLAIA